MNSVLPISAVVLLVVSQLSLILSFFLPLKVIILLGSEGMPWYFKEVFSDIDRNSLVLFLSVASLLFFVVYIFSKWFSGCLGDKGSAQLISSAQKLVLFESQDVLAKAFYLKLCESWGAIVFVVLASVIGFSFYPRAFGFLVGVSIFLVLLFSIVSRFKFGRKLLQQNYQTLLEILSGVAFIAFFGFIVGDFLVGNGVNLIYAIVSILLGRQFVQRLLSVFADADYLTSHKVKIDSLFNANAILVPSEKIVCEDYWSSLSLSARNNWLKSVVSEATNFSVRTVESEWVQLRGREIVGLNVYARGEAGEYGNHSVKVFGPRRAAMAAHEATLLGESWAENLPAPHLKASIFVDEKHCLIYEAFRSCSMERKTLKKEVLGLHSRAWGIEPSAMIVDQYSRSRPTLPRRIRDLNFDRLFMAAESDGQIGEIKQLIKVQSEIVARLIAMPVFVSNPDVRPEDVMLTSSGSVIAVNWLNWAIEPIAAGWPITEMASLEEGLKKASETRDELSDLRLFDARLAAYTFAFDRFYHRQNYSEAIGVIGDLLGCMEESATELKEPAC